MDHLGTVVPSYLGHSRRKRLAGADGFEPSQRASKTRGLPISRYPNGLPAVARSAKAGAGVRNRTSYPWGHLLYRQVPIPLGSASMVDPAGVAPALPHCECGGLLLILWARLRAMIGQGYAAYRSRAGPPRFPVACAATPIVLACRFPGGKARRFGPCFQAEANEVTSSTAAREFCPP